MAQPPPDPGRSSAANDQQHQHQHQHQHHGRVTSADSAFDNYRFTFNCSSTGSSKGSFIEPDPNLDISYEDSSESLSDSVQNFPEEFGRTYHAYRAGSYAFPNDVPERERLSLQAEIITRLFGDRLFFAPLKAHPPRTVLDIATGTGDWAIQMGDLLPEAQVTATDLSPIQPGEVPPNVEFYVEDSSEPWEYSHPYDYIHTRVTAGCWSSFKTQIAQQAFENLNPGGYFESHEFDAAVFCDDGSMPDDCAMTRWVRDMCIAGDHVGRPVVVARHLKKVYEEVGFVDVTERAFKIPTNSWPKDERLKELGRLWEANFQLGLSGFTCAMFHRAFGRSAGETEVALVDVRRELSDPRIHAYMMVHAVWGRKPFPGEVQAQPQAQ